MIFSIKKYSTSDLFYIFCLSLISIACFSSILDSYFVCDDFVCLDFMHKFWQNVPSGLFEIFCTPMRFCHEYLLTYRPLPFLFFAIEYAIFGVCSHLYHALSIVLNCLCVLLVYFLTNTIQLNWLKNKLVVKLSSFFAAALFASYPLHGEVVNWYISQFDLWCCLFYLLCIWFFVLYVQTSNCNFESNLLGKSSDDSKRNFLIVSVIFEFLALLCKEHAFMLPFVLTTYLFCTRLSFCVSNENTYFELDSLGIIAKIKKCRHKLFENLVFSFKYTSASWLVLFLFYLFRSLILGSFVGGYQGAPGDYFKLSIWDRCLHLHGFWQILFPLNPSIFLNCDYIYSALSCLYFFLALFIFLKLFFRKGDLYLYRYLLAFYLFWFLFSLMPPSPVWAIEPELTGSRHMYLASIPMLSCFTLFVFALSGSSSAGNTDSSRSNFAKLGAIVAPIILIAFVLIFSYATYSNNKAWLEAGQELKSLKEQLEVKLTNLKSDQPAVLLNPPQRRKGVHLVYVHRFLDSMLKPPNSKIDLSNKFELVQKFLFISPDLVPISRLKELAKQGKELLWWNYRTKQWQKVNLNSSENAYNLQLDISLSNELKGRKFVVLKCPSANVPEIAQKPSMLCLDLKLEPNSNKESANRRLVLWWAEANDSTYKPENHLELQAYLDGKWHKYHFSVNESLHWLFANHSGLIQIEVPQDVKSVEARNACFVDDKSLVPKLMLGPAQGKNIKNGIFPVKNDQCILFFDSSKIANAKFSMLEISDCNGNLDVYNNSYRLPIRFEHVASKLQLPLKGQVVITNKFMPKPGIYELRLYACDKDGLRLGFYGDPLWLQQINSR